MSVLAENRRVLILNSISHFFLVTLLDYLLPGRARLCLTQPFFLVTVRKTEPQESVAEALEPCCVLVEEQEV